MRNTERAVAVHFEEAALFGPIREGTPAGKKEKIVLTGVESWKELLLPFWSKKLVFEIESFSMKDEGEREM
jgi:hypothetical protein